MKKVSFILIVLAVIFLFRKLFLPGPAVWGDAPYFFPDGLRELVSFPVSWITRGNTLGSVNLFLWIYPLMVIYGALGTFLHINNDVIIRVFFYFPSLIFGFLGTVLFVRYEKYSTTVQFFATLIYLVNTYFLLVVDGGQVGVALAYGLFPLVLFTLVRLIDNLTIKNFLIALISTFVLTIVDFRISVICIGLAFVLKIAKKRRLVILAIMSLCLMGLSSYWIIPSFHFAAGSLDSSVSSLQLTSLLNALLIFSPNWPSNEFGKVATPYFYFVLIPILIFLPLFLQKYKKTVWITFVFLIFAFLVKGESAPLGGAYHLLVNTPLGVVFRDSTKFFIPVIIIGGILIGVAIEEIARRFARFSFAIKFLFFVYILFLVWQGFFGRLNGVLGRDINLGDFHGIANVLRQDDHFSRIAWFSEKPPFAYHTEEQQSLDAKDLVKLSPLSNINAGENPFNYLNDDSYVDWFRVFGIKYLIVSGNPRELSKTESEQKDWDKTVDLIEKNNKLEKIDWGVKFPIYKVNNSYPRFFAVQKIAAVIGPSTGSLFPSVYFEDGKLNSEDLEGLDAKSVSLVFNGTDKTDLGMSFLQKYFLGPNESKANQWAVYNTKDYLKYKYELLVRGINFNAFDYQKGIAFSTKAGEKITFRFSVPEVGDYVLAYRSLDAAHKNTSFKWQIVDEKMTTALKDGFEYSVENKSGFEVLNTIALIPKKEFDASLSRADVFIKHFGIMSVNDFKKGAIYKEVEVESGLDRYKFTPPDGYRWVIFNDNYNVLWKLKYNSGSSNSVPIYSAINGFYVGEKWQGTEITFKGQEYVRWGIYFSLISVFSITATLIYLHERKNS